MTKESIIELQRYDCNCNDCLYMVRDFDKYKKSEDWNRQIQLSVFEKKKEEAFRIANECTDEQGKKTLLYMANKMKFIFDRSGVLQYGNCTKLSKDVSFIPSICQLETQDCFVHRKEI